MMIAFSVASESRNPKHAYAMLARVKIQFIIWTLCMVAIAQGRIEEDIYVDEPETTTVPTTLQSHTKRLKNVENLKNNCKFERHSRYGSYRCNDFRFDDPEETAFFELPTKVRIAADGATYELGDELRLDSVTMENSTFVNFPLHLFYELPELSELDMRKCHVEHVSWESFLAANKLKILLLSDNDITQLGESLFNYAPQLEFLFLGNNRLSDLHPSTFKGLQQLRHLDLSGNRLENLPERLFGELTNLQELVLAENQLRFVSNDLLHHNTQLQTVLLHSNHLQQVDEYAFRSPTHLLLVDLSHNPALNVLLLSLNAGHLFARNCSLNRVNLFGAVNSVDLDDNHLQELYFSNSEALQHLVLRNNSLTQLATLSRVPRLRHLNVADNPQLGDLPNDWETPELQRLDLSNTGLMKLPLKALQGMPNLRNLNVSANNISEVDITEFDNLVRLTHFYIHANNWNCFSLRTLMNIVILHHGISYTVDRFDPDFPGAYIDGIACMYRLAENDIQAMEPHPDVDTAPSATSETFEYSALVSPNEVNQLRDEVKILFRNLEDRLDLLSAQVEKLNAKMATLEQMNSTLWNQISIMV